MNLNYSAGRTDFRAVIPFSKVERMPDGRLMIEGVATSEAVDHDNEIVDYESAKAAFAAWSGNIREQHDAKKAVGRALSVHADDVAKKITVRAFISNGAKDTQEKCLDGTLSCYSIGGSVEKRTPEKAKKADGSQVDINRVYVKGLSETSVVDKGSNPDSSFSLVKTVGDHLEGVGLADEAAKEDDKAKIGEVAKTVSEPIEVAGTDAQVADFGKALNDAKFTLTDAIEAIGVLVTKRADAGKTPEPPAPPTAEIMLATFTAMDEAAKAAFLGELGKLAPADPLREVLDQAMSVGAVIKRVSDPDLPMTDLADIAKTQLTDDERKTLKSIDDVRSAIVAKVKGSMTAANKDRLQAAHDHLAAMGADCDGDADKTNPTGELVKSVAALQDQVAKLNARPATHVMLRAVSKEQASSGTQTADGTTTKRDPLKEMTVEQLTKFMRADGTIDFDAASDELNKAAA